MEKWRRVDCNSKLCTSLVLTVDKRIIFTSCSFSHPLGSGSISYSLIKATVEVFLSNKFNLHEYKYFWHYSGLFICCYFVIINAQDSLLSTFSTLNHFSEVLPEYRGCWKKQIQVFCQLYRTHLDGIWKTYRALNWRNY